MINLPTLLEHVAEEAETAGLSATGVHFELVPRRVLLALMAYDGLLTRYRHWHFGKAYARFRMAQQYGGSRFYEVVVNSRPPTAYILENLSAIEYRLVALHVLAHADFFQQHGRLSAVRGDMPRVMAGHRDWVEGWATRVGRAAVDQVLQDGMVLADLLDPFDAGHDHPANLLPFIAAHAPGMTEDEAKALAILDDEARYFRPQLETKIANEGWATYWHHRLWADGPLPPSAAIDGARFHAAVVQDTGRLNPYRVGWALWQEVALEGLATAWQVRRWVTDSDLVARWFTDRVGRRLGIPRPDQEAYRASLLRRLDNAGFPRIVVDDVVDGTLVLRHASDGRELEMRDVPGAMAAVGRLWRGPCVLWTVRDGKSCGLSWNGSELRER